MRMHQVFKNLGRSRNRRQSLVQEQTRIGRQAGKQGIGGWNTMESLESRTYMTVIGSPDLYDTFENVALDVDGTIVSGVLVNDTGGTAPAVRSVISTQPTHGKVTLALDGSFDYVPNANFHGTDSFTYIAQSDPNPAALIPATGHTWKWLHPTNGANPSATDADFHTTWYLSEGNPLVPVFPGTGSGMMGYGAIDAGAITTPIGVGNTATAPASGQRYTAYFRTTFDFPSDPSSLSGLTMTGVFDDGAFFYLNGQPLGSLNMPAGAADTYTGLAANATNTEVRGTVDLFAQVPNLASRLVQGTNTLAISLHNSAADSSDLGMEVAVNATFAEQSAPTTVTINVQDSFSPPVGTPDSYTVAEGGTLQVLPAANLLINDGELSIDGGVLFDILPPDNLPAGAIFTPDVPSGTFNLNLSGAPDFFGPITFSYILEDIHGQSAPIPVTIFVTNINDAPVAVDDPAPGMSYEMNQGTILTSGVNGPQVPIFGVGATWDYDDSGTDLHVRNANWNDLGFDPTNPGNGSPAWKSGAGELGYGDDQATVLSFGPSAANVFVTYYFRKTFNIASAADFNAGTFGIEYDDGAVLYINGREIFRENMPTGNIGNGTLATAGATENVVVTRQFFIPQGVLVDGDNVVAVEIHQNAINSSDVSFDMSMSLFKATGVIVNDLDADSGGVTAMIDTQPLHGQVVMDQFGNFTYTPLANYFGPDSFTYTITDGLGLESTTATVNINILEADVPPTPTNDTYSFPEGGTLDTAALGVSLLSNDALERPLTSLQVIQQPTGGAFFVTPPGLDGNFVLSHPNPEFSGQVTFSYQLTDEVGTGPVATVTIDITPVNDRPIAVDDPAIPGAFTTLQNTQYSSSSFFNLLSHGASWQALNIQDGIDPAIADTDFNTTWFLGGASYNGPAFTAPTPAPFSYGGVDGLAGGTALTTPPNSLRNTAYFKTTFNFSGNPAEILRLTANLLVDDGIAIYLNGNLVGRQNFTAADTYAAVAVGTQSESTFVDVNLTNIATSLVNGVNVLAVSVHQANNTSSDLGFDLGLKAFGAAGAGLLVNDTDIDTPTTSLTANIGALPLYGTLTLQGDGQFFYVPGPNFIGADTFTYFANDGSNNSVNPATVTINVTDGNLPPILVNDANLYITNEDTTLDTALDDLFDSVYRNDGLLDADGVAFDPILDVIVDDSATSGTVVFDVATGHFVFTPDPDFSGPTTFTYEVIDKDGLSNTGVVTITVNPVNDLPVANDDFYQVIENGSVGETAGMQVFPRFSTWFYEDTAQDLHTLEPTWNLLGFDPQAPIGGPVWKSGVGKFGFGDAATTPLLDLDQSAFYLRKNFTLTGEQASSFDTLRMNVLRDDGVVIYINGIEVLRSNMPTGVITYATLSPVAIDGANETTYFPFTIDLSDLALFPGGSPLESGDNVIAVELHQASLTSSDIGFDMDLALFAAGVGLLANDTDPEGAILTASLLTQPQFGSVTMTNDGSFLYTPFGNYSGPDSFTYRASDGVNFSLPATVHITVDNDPSATPVALDDDYSMFEDTTLVVSDPASGLLSNEYGIPAGLTIVYNELTDGPANGTLTLNLTDGTFTYQPNLNFWGTETFTYRVTDGVLTSDPATVTISVSNEPDPPIAIDDAHPQYTAEEGGAPLDTTAISAPSLLDNDLSPDGVAITASLLSADPGGTVVVNTDGSFVFTPGPNFYGEYHFQYLARSAAIRLVERGGTAAQPGGDQLWSYLDNGTNPGAAWNTPGFDDTAWATGVGELGYGDGDERTTVAFIDADPATPGSVEKNATTYFRTTFHVLDASAITQLIMSANWDDGIAVYINGQEVMRQFLAPDAAFNTFATAGPPVEGTFATTNITVTPGMLVDGDNVIAVEVHQVNATSSDLSFDLELDALFATSAEVTVNVNPTAPRAPIGVFDVFNGEEDVPLVGNVLLNEFGPDLTVNLFSGTSAEYGDLVLNPDGSFVFTPAPNFNTTQLPPEQFPGDPAAYLLFFYTVTRDYGGGLLLTGDPIFVQLNLSPTPDAPVGSPDAYDVVDGENFTANVSTATVDLVARGGTALAPLGTQNWSYLDDGSDMGVFWRSNNFDDSFWSTGISQLGYGDGDERTVVNSVDVDDVTPGLQRNATTYYRTHFFVDDPSTITQLLLSVYADDGVAVYLNGREVFRNNLIADAAFDTYAIAGIGTEDIFLDSVIAVTPGLLRSGDNVIAVEVHQDTAASSDTSMDLQLSAVVVTENSGVLANDSDPDYQAVTATLVTPPQFHDDQGGTAPFVLNANGSFNYRRMAGVYGDDTFTYTISDGVNTSNPITVTLTADSPGLPRDVNADGFYTTADIDALGRYLFQGGPLPAGDSDLTGGDAFNGYTGVPDGVIDVNDRDFLVTYVLGTFFGDANYDIEGGIGDFVSISIGDLVILATNFEKPGPWGWSDGDFNSDNTITIGDLVLLAANFNSTAPVPNPPFGNGLLVGQDDGDVDALGLMADGDGSWDYIDEALNGKKKSADHIIDVLAEI